MNTPTRRAVTVLLATALALSPLVASARNAKELQAFLKAKPGAYNYAS